MRIGLLEKPMPCNRKLYYKLVYRYTEEKPSKPFPYLKRIFESRIIFSYLVHKITANVIHQLLGRKILYLISISVSTYLRFLRLMQMTQTAVVNAPMKTMQPKMTTPISNEESRSR